jgi:predicted MFS family arabinose efflux permease
MIIALPWEAYSLTHSATSTAFVSAAQIAPYPVLGIVSGVIADRLDRRRVMIASDAARAVLTGIITLAIALGLLRMWMLVTGTVILGTCSAIFDASYVSITPQIVPADLLNAANGRLESSNAAAGIIGPEIGGVLISAVGAVGTFGLDAFSYLVGAIGSSLIRFRHHSHTKADGWHEIMKMGGTGVNYLARSPILRLLTAASASLAIANGALDGLLVPLLRGQLHYSGLAVGAVFSLGAVGWLISSILAARTKAGDKLPTASLIAVILAIVGGTCVGLGRTVYVSAAALFLFQAGVFYFLITVVTLRQRIGPAEFLGRVHALARALGNLGTPLGAAVGGVIAAGLPIGPTVSVLCSFPLALAFCLAWRATRLTPGPA